MLMALAKINRLFSPFLFNSLKALGYYAPLGHFAAMRLVGRKAWQIASPNPFLLLPRGAEARVGMTLG